MTEGIVFRPEIRFICPYCKLEVVAGYEEPDEEPSLLHADPPCEIFQLLPIDEFLARCRAIFEGRKGD